MAIQQASTGAPGSQQGMGGDVGAQAGTGQLSAPNNQGDLMEQVASALPDVQGMKVLKPLPHAVIDYAWAGTMMAAPCSAMPRVTGRRVGAHLGCPRTFATS